MIMLPTVRRRWTWLWAACSDWIQGEEIVLRPGSIRVPLAGSCDGYMCAWSLMGSSWIGIVYL